MTTVVTLTSSIHPSIQQGMDSINLPEVQDLIKRLSEYGLAVAIPHMHGDDGTFLPLPDDRVVLESSLHMSFPQKDSSALESSMPVMWRWNGKAEAVAACANCDMPNRLH